MHKLTIALLGLAALVVTVNGHGRLVQPAGRGSLWRNHQFQVFNPYPDYNDNEGFCGGFRYQYEQQGGKCGVCGDHSQPRAHEGGGLYGRGIISGNYTTGQVVEVGVDLTASHLGYFEFRVCPHNNPLVPVTQDCLDQHVLQLADGSGTRYPINYFKQDERIHKVSVKLPDGITCRQCVLQWHYNTGNSNGICGDGESRLGCGNQEQFRACADITIR